ncbi:hypothetical protein CerSpe_019060 [Prunus speciosa]
MAKDVEVAEIGSFSAKDYHDPSPAPLFDAVKLTKWSSYRVLIAKFIATLLFPLRHCAHCDWVQEPSLSTLVLSIYEEICRTYRRSL